MSIDRCSSTQPSRLNTPATRTCRTMRPAIDESMPRLTLR